MEKKDSFYEMLWNLDQINQIRIISVAKIYIFIIWQCMHPHQSKNQDRPCLSFPLLLEFGLFPPVWLFCFLSHMSKGKGFQNNAWKENWKSDIIQSLMSISKLRISKIP